MNIIQGSGGGKGGGGGGGGVVANDTLKSKQFARIIDVVCEGEIEGLKDGERSIYLDDVPLQSISNGVLINNFLDVSYRSTTGTQAQLPLEGFDSGVESEKPAGTVPIIQSSPLTKPISSVDVNRVRINLSVPSLTFTDMANGNVSGSSIQYKISWTIDGGTLTPLLLGITVLPAIIASNIATTVANSLEFTGSIKVTNPFDYIVQAVVRTDYRISPAGGWNVIEEKTLKVPASGYNGWDGPYVTGEESFPFTKTGLAENTYDIRVVVVSGGVTATMMACNSTIKSTTITLTGKASAKYPFSHEIVLPSFNSTCTITVERLSADANPSAGTNNYLNWDTYTEIIDTVLNYPNTALIGIKVDTTQFRNIPKRSYHLKLKKVSIPTNYNPITKVYTGIWDGTFVTAWTDNPAWCFYDLVTNSRYGLGEFIPSTWVDKAALYTIGQYCDALVPDGKGGKGGNESRFTCNLYIQNQEEAYRVIQNMASIFRGMLYWLGGAITPVADKPEDVWAQFTNADVIDGLFAYQGSANRARHTVALVTWNDRDERFKQKIEYVEDTEGINRYGVNQIEVPAMGCTSRGQAHRLGKWVLYSERLETEVISFKAGLKSTNLLPGKIISVADQFRAGARNGGRVVSSTNTSLTIDSPVTLESSSGNVLSMEMPDGTVVTRALLNTTGSTGVLNWTDALSTQPINGSIWVLSEANLVPETWRVLSITEESDNTYSINALAHNTSKFDFIEQDIRLVVQPTSIYTDITKVDSIVNPVASDSIYKLSNDTIATKLHVSWEVVKGA